MDESTFYFQFKDAKTGLVIPGPQFHVGASEFAWSPGGSMIAFYGQWLDSHVASIRVFHVTPKRVSELELVQLPSVTPPNGAAILKAATIEDLHWTNHLDLTFEMRAAFALPARTGTGRQTLPTEGFVEGEALVSLHCSVKNGNVRVSKHSKTMDISK